MNYGEVHSKYGFELNPKKHELKCVSEDYLKKSPNSLLSDGDFVFADTSEDIEGSGNFTYLNGEHRVFAGYHTVIARPLGKTNKRFLAYLCDSLSYRGQIRQKVKGVKVYSITKGILKSTAIWLPKSEEQKSIVNFLDEKTAQIADAIAIKETNRPPERAQANHHPKGRYSRPKLQCADEGLRRGLYWTDSRALGYSG